MRLREIGVILSDEMSKLKDIQYNAVSGGSVQLGNYLDAMKALEKLSQFEFLKQDINEIITHFPEVYNSLKPEVFVKSEVGNNLKTIIHRIIMKISSGLLLIEEVTNPENEETISVKLPDFRGLDEASKFFNNLNNALQMAVVNDDLKGKVELKSFESGSMWIGIWVGSVLAVKFIGKLVSSALQIKEHYHKVEMIKTQALIYGTQADFIDSLTNNAKQVIDKLVEEQTKEIIDEESLPSDPEYTGKLQKSIQILGELIYQGAQIRPAIMSSPEIKEEYPKIMQIEGKEELTKLIENAEE